MKKLLVLLAVLCLLAFAGGAHAVTLDKGWYAEFDYPMLEGTADANYWWSSDWAPTSATGQFGHLLVEETASSRSRRITVLDTADFTPGVVFEDWGSISGNYPSYETMEMRWKTNYNPTKLQLRVYRRRPGWAQDELVWAQMTPGTATNFGNVWDTSPLIAGDSVGFRLVVLPEPGGLSLLGAGALLICGAMGKRRRQ